jgi:hypothetical protein
LLGVVTLAALACACLATSAQAYVFRVSVSRTQTGHPIPSDFLGLALEYRAIPELTGSTPATVDPVFVQLIRNLVPQGRPMLRIGGLSTDRTWWPVRGVKQPLGITYDLSPSWMGSAVELARSTNARLILGLGLQANQPRIDTVEADQLLKGIGRQYIAALEIGNEPELYTSIPWYRKLNGKPIPWYEKDGTPVFARPPGYGPAAFIQDFKRALHALPQVPVAGPATGLGSWLTDFQQLLSRRSRVRIVTWHAYGLNQCVTTPSSPQYPSIPNLVSPTASRGFVAGLEPFVSFAHRVGASFRVDEMNSVSCNGRLGVSNTLASGLWIMDSLFTLDADGVDGVNVHTYTDAANGLFDFSRSHGQWEGEVHPLYYGMLMFAQAAPPGSRLLRIQSGNQDRLRAWATLAPDHRTRVLLINDSLNSAALAKVRAAGARGTASLESLRASSAYATSGVSLGGQTFGSQTPTGALAPPRAQTVAPRSGVYNVELPPGSATLVTFAPR